jgi:hypothetical protein
MRLEMRPCSDLRRLRGLMSLRSLRMRLRKMKEREERSRALFEAAEPKLRLIGLIKKRPR